MALNLKLPNRGRARRSSYRQLMRAMKAEDWVFDNPILESTELGYDITNNGIKIGDGKTRWVELPFMIVGNIPANIVTDQPVMQGALTQVINALDAYKQIQTSRTGLLNTRMSGAENRLNALEQAAGGGVPIDPASFIEMQQLLSSLQLDLETNASNDQNLANQISTLAGNVSDLQNAPASGAGLVESAPFEVAIATVAARNVYNTPHGLGTLPKFCVAQLKQTIANSTYGGINTVAGTLFDAPSAKYFFNGSTMYFDLRNAEVLAGFTYVLRAYK